MTQDERWYANWKEVMDFMEAHKRRPSKYDPEERNQWNWLRHAQKLHNAGGLKPERVELFKKLMELCEKYKHVNQWK